MILKQLADIAQLAEQLICNQQVAGSSPIVGFKTLADALVFFIALDKIKVSVIDLICC